MDHLANNSLNHVIQNLEQLNTPQAQQDYLENLVKCLLSII